MCMILLLISQYLIQYLIHKYCTFFLNIAGTETTKYSVICCKLINITIFSKIFNTYYIQIND